VTWRVYRHDLVVSPAVAEKAIQLAEAYGAVPKAMCTQAVTSILRDLPGFEGIPRTLFPTTAMAAVEKLPGVTEQVFRDNDPDDNRQILAPPV
jgi:hypothetical protein